jgi:hypothetical protein
LKLENFGITGAAVDDIAEGQVKSREHVVGVVWFILAPSLAFLRHEQFVVTTIEIGRNLGRVAESDLGFCDKHV